MTDKQTNTCEFLNICQTDCNGILENTEMCHCYELYKQLKCKEQECELLKEDEKSLLNVIDHLQKTKNEWEEKYNDLGQDFDQLKAENVGVLKQLEFVRTLNTVQKAEIRKLTKILAEIKEIAEKIDDSDGCAYGDYDCDNCFSLEQETACTYKVKKLILQKISEREVEDEN